MIFVRGSSILEFEEILGPILNYKVLKERHLPVRLILRYVLVIDPGIPYDLPITPSRFFEGLNKNHFRVLQIILHFLRCAPVATISSIVNLVTNDKLKIDTGSLDLTITRQGRNVLTLIKAQEHTIIEESACKFKL